MLLSILWRKEKNSTDQGCPTSSINVLGEGVGQDVALQGANRLGSRMTGDMTSKSHSTVKKLCHFFESVNRLLRETLTCP